MTLDELTALSDILQWAKQQAKTDGLYVRIVEAQKWVRRDRNLKLMNPVLSKEKDRLIE